MAARRGPVYSARVTVGDRLILAMNPGQEHSVESLAAAVREDYSKVAFSLSQLQSFGFVNDVGDDRVALSRTGCMLHSILTSV